MSVYKLKNGTWKVEVSFKDIATGKYKRFYGKGRTRREAQQIESALLAKTRNLTPKLQFKTIALDFLESCKEKRKYSTINHYRKIVTSQLLPYFGEIDFMAIDSDLIRQWKAKMVKAVSEKTGKPYSLEYLRHCWKLLRLVFKHAITFKLVNPALQGLDNFAPDPNAITESEPPLRFWTVEEFKRWDSQMLKDISQFETWQDHYLTYSATRILVCLSFFAGLRKGEANALKVSDVDLGEYPHLSITKSVSQKLSIDGYLTTSPKSKSSIREVPIPQTLVDILKFHIENVLSKTGLDDPFLTYGYAPLPDSTAASIKNKVEKEAGIPHIRIHDLRHSYVSMLINAGVPIETIAKLVGHASTDLTYKIYSHLYPKTGSEAVNKINDIFKGDKKP